MRGLLGVARVVLLAGLLVCAWGGPAAAAPPDPGADIIYTYGYLDIMKEVMESVKALLADGDFAMLIKIVMVASVFFVGLSMFFSMRMERALEFPKLFIIALVVYAFFIGPEKVPLVIYDVPSNEFRDVTNVPLGIAKVASAFSRIEWALTDMFERHYTTFDTASGLTYGTSGLGFSLAAVSNIADVMPTDVYLQRTMDDYTMECIYYDVLTSVMDLDALQRSSDFITDMRVDTPRLTRVYGADNGAGTIMTCPEAYAEIVTRTTEHTDNVVGPQLASAMGFASRDAMYARLGLVNNVMFNISSDGKSALMTSMAQNMYGSAVKKASAMSGVTPSALGYAMASAEQSTRGGFATGGLLAKRYLPIIKGILTSLVYAAVPIQVIFMFTPMVYGAVRTLITLNLWLILWNPLFSILNLIINVKARDMYTVASSSHGMTSFLSMSLKPAVSTMTIDTLAWVGYLAWSVPVMAYMIAKGSEMAITNLAGDIGSKVGGAAQSAGGQAALGNVSFANQNYDTFNAHKVNARSTMLMGREFNAGIQESTPGWRGGLSGGQQTMESTSTEPRFNQPVSHAALRDPASGARVFQAKSGSQDFTVDGRGDMVAAGLAASPFGAAGKSSLMASGGVMDQVTSAERIGHAASFAAKASVAFQDRENKDLMTGWEKSDSGTFRKMRAFSDAFAQGITEAALSKAGYTEEQAADRAKKMDGSLGLRMVGSGAGLSVAFNTSDGQRKTVGLSEDEVSQVSRQAMRQSGLGLDETFTAAENLKRNAGLSRTRSGSDALDAGEQLSRTKDVLRAEQQMTSLMKSAGLDMDERFFMAMSNKFKDVNLRTNPDDVSFRNMGTEPWMPAVSHAMWLSRITSAPNSNIPEWKSPSGEVLKGRQIQQYMAEAVFFDSLRNTASPELKKMFKDGLGIDVGKDYEEIRSQLRRGGVQDAGKDIEGAARSAEFPMEGPVGTPGVRLGKTGDVAGAKAALRDEVSQVELPPSAVGIPSPSAARGRFEAAEGAAIAGSAAIGAASRHGEDVRRGMRAGTDALKGRVDGSILAGGFKEAVEGIQNTWFIEDKMGRKTPNFLRLDEGGRVVVPSAPLLEQRSKDGGTLIEGKDGGLSSKEGLGGIVVGSSVPRLEMTSSQQKSALARVDGDAARLDGQIREEQYKVDLADGRIPSLRSAKRTVPDEKALAESARVLKEGDEARSRLPGLLAAREALSGERSQIAAANVVDGGRPGVGRTEVASRRSGDGGPSEVASSHLPGAGKGKSFGILSGSEAFAAPVPSGPGRGAPPPSGGELPGTRPVRVLSSEAGRPEGSPVLPVTMSLPSGPGIALTEVTVAPTPSGAASRGRGEGYDVLAAQMMLGTLTRADGKPYLETRKEDLGRFNPEMAAAVRQYQADHGMQPTRKGTIGPRTWNSLVSETSARMQGSGPAGSGPAAPLPAEPPRERPGTAEFSGTRVLGDGGREIREAQEMMGAIRRRPTDPSSVAMAYEGKATGVLDAETSESLRKFQGERHRGLEATGNLDRGTWDRIREEYAAVSGGSARMVPTPPPKGEVPGAAAGAPAGGPSGEREPGGGSPRSGGAVPEGVRPVVPGGSSGPAVAGAREPEAVPGRKEGVASPPGGASFTGVAFPGSQDGASGRVVPFPERGPSGDSVTLPSGRRMALPGEGGGLENFYVRHALKDRDVQALIDRGAISEQEVRSFGGRIADMARTIPQTLAASGGVTSEGKYDRLAESKMKSVGVLKAMYLDGGEAGSRAFEGLKSLYAERDEAALSAQPLPRQGRIAGPGGSSSGQASYESFGALTAAMRQGGGAERAGEIEQYAKMSGVPRERLDAVVRNAPSGGDAYQAARAYAVAHEAVASGKLPASEREVFERRILPGLERGEIAVGGPAGSGGAVPGSPGYADPARLTSSEHRAGIVGALRESAGSGASSGSAFDGLMERMRSAGAGVKAGELEEFVARKGVPAERLDAVVRNAPSDRDPYQAAKAYAVAYDAVENGRFRSESDRSAIRDRVMPALERGEFGVSSGAVAPKSAADYASPRYRDEVNLSSEESKGRLVRGMAALGASMPEVAGSQGAARAEVQGLRAAADYRLASSGSAIPASSEGRSSDPGGSGVSRTGSGEATRFSEKLDLGRTPSTVSGEFERLRVLERGLENAKRGDNALNVFRDVDGTVPARMGQAESTSYLARRVREQESAAHAAYLGSVGPEGSSAQVAGGRASASDGLALPAGRPGSAGQGVAPSAERMEALRASAREAGVDERRVEGAARNAPKGSDGELAAQTYVSAATALRSGALAPAEARNLREHVLPALESGAVSVSAAPPGEGTRAVSPGSLQVRREDVAPARDERGVVAGPGAMSATAALATAAGASTWDVAGLKKAAAAVGVTGAALDRVIESARENGSDPYLAARTYVTAAGAVSGGKLSPEASTMFRERVLPALESGDVRVTRSSGEGSRPGEPSARYDARENALALSGVDMDTSKGRATVVRELAYAGMDAYGVGGAAKYRDMEAMRTTGFYNLADKGYVRPNEDGTAAIRVDMRNPSLPTDRTPGGVHGLGSSGINPSERMARVAVYEAALRNIDAGRNDLNQIVESRGRTGYTGADVERMERDLSRMDAAAASREKDGGRMSASARQEADASRELLRRKVENLKADAVDVSSMRPEEARRFVQGRLEETARGAEMAYARKVEEVRADGGVAPAASAGDGVARRGSSASAEPSPVAAGSRANTWSAGDDVRIVASSSGLAPRGYMVSQDGGRSYRPAESGESVEIGGGRRLEFRSVGSDGNYVSTWRYRDAEGRSSNVAGMPSTPSEISASEARARESGRPAGTLERAAGASAEPAYAAVERSALSAADRKVINAGLAAVDVASGGSSAAQAAGVRRMMDDVASGAVRTEDRAESVRALGSALQEVAPGSRYAPREGGSAEAAPGAASGPSRPVDLERGVSGGYRAVEASRLSAEDKRVVTEAVSKVEASSAGSRAVQAEGLANLVAGIQSGAVAVENRSSASAVVAGMAQGAPGFMERRFSAQESIAASDLSPADKGAVGRAVSRIEADAPGNPEAQRAALVGLRNDLAEGRVVAVGDGRAAASAVDAVMRGGTVYAAASGAGLSDRDRMTLNVSLGVIERSSGGSAEAQVGGVRGLLGDVASGAIGMDNRQGAVQVLSGIVASGREGSSGGSAAVREPAASAAAVSAAAEVYGRHGVLPSLAGAEALYGNSPAQERYAQMSRLVEGGRMSTREVEALASDPRASETNRTAAKALVEDGRSASREYVVALGEGLARAGSSSPERAAAVAAGRAAEAADYAAVAPGRMLSASPSADGGYGVTFRSAGGEERTYTVSAEEGARARSVAASRAGVSPEGDGSRPASRADVAAAVGALALAPGGSDRLEATSSAVAASGMTKGEVAAVARNFRPEDGAERISLPSGREVEARKDLFATMAAYAATREALAAGGYGERAVASVEGTTLSRLRSGEMAAYVAPAGSLDGKGAAYSESAGGGSGGIVVEGGSLGSAASRREVAGVAMRLGAEAASAGSEAWRRDLAADAAQAGRSLAAEGAVVGSKDGTFAFASSGGERRFESAVGGDPSRAMAASAAMYAVTEAALANLARNRNDLNAVSVNGSRVADMEPAAAKGHLEESRASAAAAYAAAYERSEGPAAAHAASAAASAGEPAGRSGSGPSGSEAYAAAVSRGLAALGADSPEAKAARSSGDARAAAEYGGVAAERITGVSGSAAGGYRVAFLDSSGAERTYSVSRAAAEGVVAGAAAVSGMGLPSGPAAAASPAGRSDVAAALGASVAGSGGAERLERAASASVAAGVTKGEVEEIGRNFRPEDGARRFALAGGETVEAAKDLAGTLEAYAVGREAVANRRYSESASAAVEAMVLSQIRSGDVAAYAVGGGPGSRGSVLASGTDAADVAGGDGGRPLADRVDASSAAGREALAHGMARHALGGGERGGEGWERELAAYSEQGRYRMSASGAMERSAEGTYRFPASGSGAESAFSSAARVGDASSRMESAASAYAASESALANLERGRNDLNAFSMDGRRVADMDPEAARAHLEGAKASAAVAFVEAYERSAGSEAAHAAARAEGVRPSAGGEEAVASSVSSRSGSATREDLAAAVGGSASDDRMERVSAAVASSGTTKAEVDEIARNFRASEGAERIGTQSGREIEATKDLMGTVEMYAAGKRAVADRMYSEEGAAAVERYGLSQIRSGDLAAYVTAAEPRSAGAVSGEPGPIVAAAMYAADPSGRNSKVVTDPQMPEGASRESMYAHELAHHAAYRGGSAGQAWEWEFAAEREQRRYDMASSGAMARGEDGTYAFGSGGREPSLWSDPSRAAAAGEDVGGYGGGDAGRERTGRDLGSTAYAAAEAGLANLERGRNDLNAFSMDGRRVADMDPEAARAHLEGAKASAAAAFERAYESIYGAEGAHAAVPPPAADARGGSQGEAGPRGDAGGAGSSGSGAAAAERQEVTTREQPIVSPAERTTERVESQPAAQGRGEEPAFRPFVPEKQLETLRQESSRETERVGGGPAIDANELRKATADALDFRIGLYGAMSANGVTIGHEEGSRDRERVSSAADEYAKGHEEQPYARKVREEGAGYVPVVDQEGRAQGEAFFGRNAEVANAVYADARRAGMSAADVVGTTARAEQYAAMFGAEDPKAFMAAYARYEVGLNAAATRAGIPYSEQGRPENRERVEAVAAEYHAANEGHAFRRMVGDRWRDFETRAE